MKDRAYTRKHITIVTGDEATIKALESYTMKTKLIIFSRKFTNNKILSPLMVKNTPIKPVKEVKYLGFKLDARLHFNKHVGYAIQKTFMAPESCTLFWRQTHFYHLKTNFCSTPPS
ncbi:hypothetical protein YQE_00239, partial [Dendroctonus ponderosae]